MIGTNKHDATETVHSLLQDAPTLPRREVRDPDGIVDLLHQRGVRVVPWQGWEAIEALKIAAGQRRGAKQVKVAKRELLWKRRPHDVHQPPVTCIKACQGLAVLF